MSNKKKLKNKDGATRIVPMAGGAANLYGVQYYDNITESWEDVEGLYNLTWEKAQTQVDAITLRRVTWCVT